MAFSRLEKAMALVIGLDIATPGFSRNAAKAAVSAIGRASLGTARAVAPVATRAAVANPAAVGVGLGLGALQTEPGETLLEMAAARGRRDRQRFEQLLTDIEIKTKRSAKKKKTKFNKAVSKAMSVIKASPSIGKKGAISNSKKAFTTATKTVAAVKKTGKIAKSGIKRKIGLAIRKLL